MMKNRSTELFSEFSPTYPKQGRITLRLRRLSLYGLMASLTLSFSFGYSQDAGASLNPAFQAGKSDQAWMEVEDDEVPKALYVLELDPNDFLEKISQHTKARWRQQYRAAPPTTPPADRMRAAFGLGGLLADTYLAQQAQDIQQIKNVNQDVLKHANALALGDRLHPIILMENKMAESEDWIALRAKIFQTQEQIDDCLHQQRDEDLAAMVTMGIWLRLFQVTTCIASSDQEMTDKMLAIGSIEHLNALYRLYEQTRRRGTDEDKTLYSVGKVLNALCKIWNEVPENQPPSQELLESSKERLDVLWAKVTTFR